MKKILTGALLLAVSNIAFADANIVSLVSPRTGITYSLESQANQKIVLKTEEIKAATAETAQRIVAKNPALSAESQEKARLALSQGVAQ